MALSRPPSLPVIDIDPLLHADARARRRVAETMGAACETTGSFYVQNHGVAPWIIDAALDAGRRFFDSPDVRKRAYARPRSRYRDYIATMRYVGEDFSKSVSSYDSL